MIYRRPKEGEEHELFKLMCLVDGETEYMLYRPGERQYNPHMYSALVSGGDGVFCAVTEEEGELLGYVMVRRDGLFKNRHVGHLVIGIRDKARGKGAGKALMNLADRWCRDEGIRRLELTVICKNTAAFALYKSMGFEVEGTRKGSVLVLGNLEDEYYMAKVY